MFYRFFALLLQEAQAVWRKVVKTGTGLIVANNTTEGQKVDLQMQGWTEQNQYEGKNLIQINMESSEWTEEAKSVLNPSITKDGKLHISCKNIEKSYSITIYGQYQQNTLPIQSEKSYSCLIDYINDISSIAIAVRFDGSQNILNKTNKNFTVSNKNYLQQIFISIPAGTTYDGDIGVMFNEGSTALPYEPYTGNQPSPSPEYPQEIVNAGTYNEGTGKYEVEVELFGKNRLKEIVRGAIDINNGSIVVGNNFISKEMIPVIPGKYIVFSANGQKYTLKSIVYYDENKNFIKVAQDWSGKVIDNAKYCNFVIGSAEASEMVNPMIEIQDTNGNPTQYEPYKEPQTVTVTSDRPITKWDRLVEKDGQIGWEYGSINFEVDGNGDWQIYDGQNGFYKRNALPIVMNNRQGFCNQFRTYTYLVQTPSVKFGIGNTSLYITNMKTYYDDALEDKGLSNWKTHLNESPLVIQTYTDTPEFVPLPSEEQEAIRTLRTYYPTTVFSNNNEMFMQIEYQTNVPEQEV